MPCILILRCVNNYSHATDTGTPCVQLWEGPTICEVPILVVQIHVHMQVPAKTVSGQNEVPVSVRSHLL
jgi:hypothetical protein